MNHLDKPHLFIIGRNTIAAVSVKEIQDTYQDLKELDLHHLPYKKCIVRIPACAPVSDGWIKKRRFESLGHSWIERYLEQLPDGSFRFDIPGGWFENHLYEPKQVDIWFDETNKHMKEGMLFEKELGRATVEWELKTCEKVEQLLVVLLATKNIVKTTHVDKLARMGIGLKHKHRFIYTTTISVPTDIEDDEHLVVPGKPKVPHLRRGHIRRQRFGPGNEFIKKIWIAPLIVNADKEFVDQRGAYNVNIRL